jgi:hypothetical protein
MLAPPDKKRLPLGYIQTHHVRRAFRPKIRVGPTPALKQAEYRARQDRQEIRPPVPLTGRTIELLIVMATKHGKISRSEAEKKSLDRRWLVGELVRLLDKLADDMGVEK